MATISFFADIAAQAGLRYNAYSTSNIDPIALLNDPGRFIFINQDNLFVIQVAGTLPNGIATTFRVQLNPATTFTVNPNADPTGVVNAISVSALDGGIYKTILSVNSLASLNLLVSQLTNPALFSGADSANGSTKDELFNSGAGADTLNGGGGNDTLLAGGGADILNGGAGDDVLSGDGVGAGAENNPSGADTLNGGAGGDVLYGADGDTFVISSVADSPFGYDNATQRFLGDVIYDFSGFIGPVDLTAVPGRIILHTLSTTFYLYVDSDSDGLAETGEGQVTINTQAFGGQNLLIGGRGITFYGDATNNTLQGSEVADVLAGFGGQDVLIGRGGGDSIYVGGDGASDTITYFLASHSAYSLVDVAGTNVDKVYGFVVGQDKLDFVSIAGAKTASIQTLGGSTFVYVDLGSDGSFDMEVIVVGVTGLTQGDILGATVASPDEAGAAPVVGAEAEVAPAPGGGGLLSAAGYLLEEPVGLLQWEYPMLRNHWDLGAI